MNELSIEEKARAYDEAIERANSLLSSNELGNAWIYKLLPELKESEDERIRKELICFLETEIPQCNARDKYIAWLEKQGKNNMGISEATKKKLEDNLTQALEKETPESWNKFLDEQGEQKPVEWNEEDDLPEFESYLCLMFQKFRTKGMCTNDEIIDFVEEHSQKLKDTLCHAWSEEDEKMLSNTIKDLVHPWNEYIPDRIEEEIKWLKNKLKSLRPQNRQEWNSKDKKIKNEIVNYFTCQCKDEPTRIKTLNRWICWLNALENSSVIKPMPEFDEWLKQIWDILDWAEEKGRITYSTWEDYTGWLSLLNPKNRWKPSEEEMKALADALSLAKNCGEENAFDLRTLYEQLKKLSGE